MSTTAARDSLVMAATGAPAHRRRVSTLPALVPYGVRGGPGVQPAARPLNRPHRSVRGHRHPFAPATLAVVPAGFFTEEMS
ncbi:hypothetical protein [Streptosporangium minutum]|uniref:Uncharacterized protein n=1 Tax=Streptosporangium minutum TaxID=569862 RepID=A0A243R6A7_9ACTN|nr:hypothetical protein [Streptosporangium minutum]OUC90115.1 hypothetical protein CA984_36585 [Streptosporangium minutum]